MNGKEEKERGREQRKVHARTERLLLRDWTPGDVDAYAEIVGDAGAMRFIGDGKPRPREHAEWFVASMIERQNTRGWMRFAVEDAQSGRLAGYAGFEISGRADGERSVVDLGWRFHRDFWGKGFGGEAAAAALRVGTETFGLRREDITAQSLPENLASVRIIERLGMREMSRTEAFGRPLVVFGFTTLPASRQDDGPKEPTNERDE